MSEINAKEKIINETISLIQEGKNVDEITIRKIAERANAGIGLINYHFNTKENLINHCVRIIVSQIIGKFNPIYNSLDCTPVEKLKYMAKSTSNFMVTNAGISRISILHDFQEGSIEDNTIRSSEAYYQIFREIFGDKKSERELKIMLQMFVATIQVTFLHSEVYKEYSGIDFFDKKEREAFIDDFLDILLKGNL